MATDNPTQRDRLVRLETLIEGVAKGQDRIEGTLAEIGKANEEWRTAHAKDTQDKLDHHRRGVDAKLQGFEKALDKKADEKDLSFLQKIVFGACAIILVAFVGALVGIVWPKHDKPAHREPVAVVQQVAPR